MNIFKMKNALTCLIAMIILTSGSLPGFAQEQRTPLIAPGATPVALDEMVETPNRMRPILNRYSVDFRDLQRTYDIQLSAERFARGDMFFADWQTLLTQIDFQLLSQDGKVDFILFKNTLDFSRKSLALEKVRVEEIRFLIPFMDKIVKLQEERRRLHKVDAKEVATIVNDIAIEIGKLKSGFSAGYKSGDLKMKEFIAVRAANSIGQLQRTLKNWFEYYNGYDPLFTWWMGEPYKAADKALADYASWLRQIPGGESRRGEKDVFGDPVGRDGLLAELQFSMIPYTPEELIEIGKLEYAWCEKEMIKASRELGYGDNWLEAWEHVKTDYVEPGEQPELIKFQAYEAIDFIEKNNLMTVPQLSKDVWKMQMMSPRRQLVNPFFTGGATISVSFPTNTMTHEQKIMSLKSNNVHLTRATVHHELIAGHHMQFFANSRYEMHRRLFDTPFWLEGFALYWEMRLWDDGFPQTPENRIGMLFWRMHRANRIIFSLSYHMEQMTPGEAIEMLVTRGGHEESTAIAEVRRSFETSYGSIYQAAYMIGGLQFRKLHEELVISGKMTNKQFHDIVLKSGNIPIEMLRALITGQKLSEDFESNWKFYDF
jgi:hypothetical protein